MALGYSEKISEVTAENIFSQSPGATPLTEEEKEGLIPRAITLKSELDGAELENILKATIWLDRAKLSVEQLLTTKRMKMIHGRMFGQVWKWATQFRKTDKNIGISRHARLVTNKLLRILGEEEFTWGHLSIDEDGPIRQEYIGALRAADNHDISALLRFVRS